MANIRYDIDPELVKASVEKKVNGYKASMLEHPSHEAMYRSSIRKEREYYALVRIIKLDDPKAKKEPYVLAYGKQKDANVRTGTGGFSSIEKATKWFTNHGR